MEKSEEYKAEGAPYVGQIVILKSLLHRRDFRGTVISIERDPFIVGYCTCTVSVDPSHPAIDRVFYYKERPISVIGTHWQICYPIESDRNA